MIRMFFKLPWFVFMLAAVVALGVGAFSYNSAKTYNAHRAVALAEKVPDLIDSGEVTKASFTPVEEINVGAQISADIFTVSVSGRRTTDKEKTVIFGFSENASATTDPVNVVFLLSTRDSVTDFVAKFASGADGDLSPILHVNGERGAPGKLKKAVKDAASQASITLAPGFQFVEPFMQGRERGLELRSPTTNFAIFAILGAILAVFGLIKGAWTLRKKKKLKKLLAATKPIGPIQS